MDALIFLRTIIPVFFAILFLQSGLDKAFDWKGNLDYHREHFANTPLKHFSALNLGFIAVLEVCCGVLCVTGAVFVAWKGNNTYALMGIEMASAIFTMLFFGQRLAKDYSGAVTIVTYFILAVVSIVILS